MLEVSCQALFPEEHIQKFGLVSIGRIILTLSSSRVILCATASLDGASYWNLATDDSSILEAFANGRDAKEYLRFDPRMEIFLDLSDETDLDGDAP
jgi:hypothetical protein